MESESSFFDLMSTFSKLGLDSRPSLEKCPLCSIECSLDKFAEHVYFCIKDLDHDEKFAQEVNKNLNGSETEYDQFHLFTPPTICKDGINCTRRDAQHFKNIFHPLVDCPICSKQFSMAEINDHINTCTCACTHVDTMQKNLPELSRSQMIAISTVLVQKSETSDIADLLDTFGKMGFTRENLQREIDKN